MRTCKKCGKDVVMFATYCSECKNEIKKQEQQHQKEIELENITKEQAKKIADEELAKKINKEILSAITNNNILSYLYINHDIQEFKTIDWASLLTGVVLGGKGGEMLFGGALTNLSRTYEGYFGIAALTKNSVLIKCILSPFFSYEGDAHLDHLKFFHSKIFNNHFEFDLSYNLENSELFDVTLPDGDQIINIGNVQDSFSFNPCKLVFPNEGNCNISDFKRQFYNAKQSLELELKENEEEEEKRRMNLIQSTAKEINVKITGLQTKMVDKEKMSLEMFDELNTLLDQKEILDTYTNLSSEEKNQLFFLIETTDIDNVIVLHDNQLTEISKEEWNKIKTVSTRDSYKLLYNNAIKVDYL